MARKNAAAPAASPPPTPEPASTMSLGGLLARLYWLAFGNLAVVAALLKSVQLKEVGLADVLFWICGAGLIVVRYLDIRYLNGTTSEGQPATLADWRRYALLAAVVLGGLWGLTRLIAPITF